MTRTQFIEHEGTKILLLDFTNLVDVEEVEQTVSAAMEMVATSPEGSVLTLTNVTGIGTDAAIVKALWRLLKHNKPFVKAGAVVGISDEEQADLYQLLTHQTRRKLKTFESMNDAKEWLAEFD